MATSVSLSLRARAALLSAVSAWARHWLLRPKSTAWMLWAMVLFPWLVLTLEMYGWVFARHTPPSRLAHGVSLVSFAAGWAMCSLAFWAHFPDPWMQRMGTRRPFAWPSLKPMWPIGWPRHIIDTGNMDSALDTLDILARAHVPECQIDIRAGNAPCLLMLLLVHAWTPSTTQVCLEVRTPPASTALATSPPPRL